MGKTLDLTRTVHDLVGDYPELQQVMADIGFTDIAKPMALKTVGRVMTIPKGCAIKEFDLDDVVAKLEAASFTVVNAHAEDVDDGEGDTAGSAEPIANQPQRAETAAGAVQAASRHGQASPAPDADGASARKELLKGFVARLSAGEDLEAVRTDFTRHFDNVDALEIAQAEQELIAAGTPVSQVQKLCDVHSALFHGCTHEELLANAEAAVEAGLSQTETPDSKAKALASIPGHPLDILTRENQAIARQIERTDAALSESDGALALDELRKLRAVAIHYAKKGDLIYPILSTRYDIIGPSKVMWGVDDEIRDELRSLVADPDGEDWIARAQAVAKRADEMVYKETNILFPLCADNLSEEEWQQMRRDMHQYELCLIEDAPEWEAASPGERTAPAAEQGMIRLAGGTFTPQQLEAVLNTIPLELTFVDAENINRFFDESTPKLFKRPLAALGRDVSSCHPPQIAPMVLGIIESFRQGRADTADRWMQKGGDPVLVRYMAVRDHNGSYLGTLECVQNMAFAQEHFRQE